MSMGHILVSGASSVVGDYLLPRLAAAGHHVTALSRRPQENARGARWVQTDIRNAGIWSAVGEEVDGVVHLAPLPLLIPMLRTLPAHVQPVVVALGTTSVFTKVDSTAPNEQALVRSMQEAEQSLQQLARTGGLRCTLLRPTLVYDGKRDKNVARIARLVRRFGFFPIASPGRGLRQPLHAADLAAACLSALGHAGGAYNLGGGETLSYHAMLERIFAGLGRRSCILPLPPTAYRAAIRLARLLPRYRELTPDMAERMNQDMVFDWSGAARDLGFSPRGFAPEFET